MLRAAFIALALTTVACGAAPPAARVAPARHDGGGAVLGKKPVFDFRPWEAIAPGERRLLEASQVPVGAGNAATVLGGRELYDWLAWHGPKELANFLNQTAVLSTIRLDEGRTALDLVTKVERLKVNHVFAVVDPRLAREIAMRASKRPQDRTLYVGPEDSSLMHGKYDTSYRENRPYTSQQFCFSSKDGFTRLDLDIDEECPLAGSTVALAQHLLRAAKHDVLRRLPGEQYGENTEPDAIYRRLVRPAVKPDGTPDKVGRGLQPSYALGQGAPARPVPEPTEAI